MCLNFVTHTYATPRDGIICYKVFAYRRGRDGKPAIFGNHYSPNGSMRMCGKYKMRRTYKASRRTWTNDYPFGFHAYSTLRHARRNARSWDAIVRVRLDRVHTRGRQEGVVFVGKTMRLLSYVRRPKKPHEG